MKTTYHLLASAALATLLYPKFGMLSLIVFIGGVLIDFDHYIWYIIKEKKFSFLGCYDFFIRQTYKTNFRNVKGALLIFHTVEFMVLIYILSYFNMIILIFSLGFFLHFLMDLIDYYRTYGGFIVNHSIISFTIKHLRKT